MMKNLTFDFKGKSVVVTGGAQGIGFEIASSFLQAGAHVTIWDYSEKALKEAELSSPNLKLQKVDVTSPESCSAAALALAQPLDILINNAGITRDKSFNKMTHDEFNSVIQTNLTGLFNVTKSVFEKFSPTGPKRIVNMASVVALYGNFGQTNYAAAKAGVVGLTKTWAREFAKKEFTVNAIAPGFVATKMTEAMPEEVLKGFAAKVPVGRLAKTADIANACLFLCSNEAGYINGAVLSVDGGLVL